MKKIIFAIMLGLLAPAAFVLGAELFGVQGQAALTLTEITAGCAALACYLAVCQFWVALKDEPSGSAARWPTVIAMAAPLVAWVAYIACAESITMFLRQGLPMLAAGSCGIAIGAVLATQRTGKTKATA